jgi:hypothetical protein
MTKNKKILSIVPAMSASLIDIIITIVHQPKEYWSGNLRKANEGNPIGALFMEHHVAGLFIISGIWLIMIALLGYFLPEFIRRVFLLFCVIAHSYGASTWLAPRYGFWSAMILIAFNSILFCYIDKLQARVQSFRSSFESA